MLRQGIDHELKSLAAIEPAVQQNNGDTDPEAAAPSASDACRVRAPAVSRAALTQHLVRRHLIQSAKL
jgi:hypothetical protein